MNTNINLLIIIILNVNTCESYPDRKMYYYGYGSQNDYPEKLPFAFLLAFLIILVITLINNVISYFGNFQVEKITSLLIAAIGTAIYYYLNGDTHYFLKINPRTTLTMLVPLAFFKVTYEIDMTIFIKCLPQILVLSTVGTILFGVIFGMVFASLTNLLVQHTGEMLIFGIAMSFNKTPHAIQIYRELATLKSIITILEAESLIGITIGILAFDIALGVQQEFVTMWYHYCILIARSVVGALILGFCIGKFVSWVVMPFYNNVDLAFTIILCSVYSTYYLCEYVLGFSGPLATFIVSIYFTLDINKIPTLTYTKIRDTWSLFYSILDGLLFLQVVFTGIIRTIHTFNFHTLFQYFATYFIATIVRMVVLILLSPVLIQTFNLKSFIASLWLTRKGVLNLMLIYEAYHTQATHFAISRAMGHALFVIGGSLLINNLLSPTLLNALGLTKPNKARSSNMNNCLCFIQTQLTSFITILKLNRNISDARWSILDDTELIHPYKQKLMDDDKKNYKLWQTRKSFCNDCHREIYVEPNNREMRLMMIEARIRVLRAQRVSFVRQCEKGLITKESLSCLLQNMDNAIDAQHYKLKIQDLVDIFQKTNWVDKFKKFLTDIDRTGIKLKKPRKRFRRLCYHIVQHKAYEVFMYIVVILMFIHYYCQYNRIIALLLDTLMFSMFVIDFFLKLLSYSHIYIKEGLRLYFISDWNKFDFVLLVIGFTDIMLDFYFTLFPNTLYIQYRVLIISYQQLQNLRILKLVVILYAMVDKFAILCDRQIGKRLLVAYDMAQALLFAYNDIIHMLPQIIENSNILRILEKEILVNKEIILHELCMTHRNMEWVSVTVKSKQMVRACVINMKESIKQLSLSGYVDDYELEKLHDHIDTKAKFVLQMKFINVATPEMIFYEQPWLQNYKDIDALYKNARLLNWEAGEVMCKEGEMPPGIYIIVDGLALLTYTPNKVILDALYKTGQLPIKDYINHNNYELKQTECIFTGNSLGHLCILTNRSYNCKVTCKITTKAFLISLTVIRQALKKSEHLYNNMWKFVSVDIASSLLWNTTNFKGYSGEEICTVIEKAYVPKISGILYEVSSDIEDVLLIEGVVVDRNLGTKYIAPCSIPRYATKLKLESGQEECQAVLLVIPMKYVVHDIMDFMHLHGYDDEDQAVIVKENKNKQIDLERVFHV